MPPTERPGAGYYVTATKVTNHKGPATENGLVGIAVKQKAAKWSDGLVAAPVIAIGEGYVLRGKGVKQIPNTGIAGGAQGAAVYITQADNTLSLAAGAGKIPFGRITEVPGNSRSVPTGFVRVDLDAKDTI